MAVLVEEFRFPPDYWRKMPFVEFNAWQRYAFVRRRNKQLAAQRNPMAAMEEMM